MAAMPASLAERSLIAANAAGMSRSALIRLLLLGYLAESEAE